MAAFKIRFICGWLSGVATILIFMAVALLELNSTIQFGVFLIGMISIGWFCGTAIAKFSASLKEVMRFQGLPLKPGITKQALRSPLEFDTWLLSMRGLSRP